MAVDAITLEVIRNKLECIAEEMEIALLRSAYSSVIKEAHDASSAVFDVQGQMIAQAVALPAQLGTLMPAVKSIIQVYPIAGMRKGDVYTLNDPYEGGTHLPDIVVMMPVFYEGRIVALAANMAHHQEVGGKTPGSIPTDATEIFQEGLRMPPLKLYDAGQPNHTLFSIIRQNVRIPDVVLGDLRAQCASAHVGATRLVALFEEYGQETILSCMRELLDRSEMMMRKALGTIRPGTYRFVDYMDNDGIDLDQLIKLQAAVTIEGSDIEIDFEGTSPQVRGPVNADCSAVLSSVCFVVRAIADPSIPNNAGCYRPVKVKLPEGTLVNPTSPAPVNGRTETMKRICDLLLGAFVQAIPDRIPAASSGFIRVMMFGGYDPLFRKPYVCTELSTGGTGAGPESDGVDTQETDIGNTVAIPMESTELNYPIRIVKNQLRTDSGGPGRFRGGLGSEKVFEVVRGEVVVSHREERHFTPPWGLFGGLPAHQCRAIIRFKDGLTETILSKKVYRLTEGDQIHCWGSGGAGYGDPLARDAELVLRDVADRKVSVDAARDAYGVVIDEAGEWVDAGATEQLRGELRQKRGPITWTYDRGERFGRE